MQDLYAGSLARTSFTLVMLAIAGAMALVLGVIGIYGVIAYVVSQRTREIGIRSALGAEPRQLKKMFLLHGLALSGIGAVVGLVGALALGRLMSSLLFGIRPDRPAAYVAALGIVIAAAALASYLPARRAATIDPTKRSGPSSRRACRPPDRCAARSAAVRIRPTDPRLLYNPLKALA